MHMWVTHSNTNGVTLFHSFTGGSDHDVLQTNSTQPLYVCTVTTKLEAAAC